jgi:hypothetical protein
MRIAVAAMVRVVFAVSSFLAFASSAFAIDVVWTDIPTGQILRGSSGSGAVQVLFDASDYPSSPPTVAPIGIASDDDFLYWSDSITGQILRGSLDGQGSATLLFGRDDYPVSPTLARPAGLSVDDSFIYWADSSTGAVLRALKDGSGSVTTLYTAADYPGAPAQIFPWDVTVSGGQLYWSDSGVSQILKGAADGTSTVEAIFTSTSERANLGLDIDDGQVYWGDTTSTGQSGRVLSGSLSGIALPQVLYEQADYPTLATSAAPTGIAVQNGQIFWVDSLTRQVLSASASGSGAISVLFDIGDYPGSPAQISPTFLTVVSTEYDADFDDNGFVDGHDFLSWQRGESPAPLSADDLALWKEQYGSTPLLANVQAVPEPLAFALAVVACLATIIVARRRC